MKGIRYCKYMVWMLAIMVMLYVLPLGGILKPNALSEQRVLTVGFDAEFPPYGYKDEDGNYIGFDLDLAQAVCDRNDWLLQKQPIDWNSKDMELDSGSIDCIWNGFTMNGREDDYTWTVPYVDNSQVVIVKKGSDIGGLQDLKGKIVAVQADSSALAAFTGEDASEENKALCEEFQELQQVSDYNSAFMNLESGMVDAICMDIGVAKYQIASRGDAFVLLSEQISTEQYAVGFKLGNETLRNEVEATLLEMQKDGTFDAIVERWADWGLKDCVCLDAYTEQMENRIKEAEAGITEDDDFETELQTAVSEDLQAYENQKSQSDNQIDTDSQANADNSQTNAGKTKKTLDIKSIVTQLAEGMSATCSIFFLTLLFSMPLGLLICFLRMSKFAVFQWIARIYISIMRGTPLMLQLLVVFFAPYYAFGWQFSSNYRFYAVIIGFSLNYAAYFAEIFRSGIQGVPQGQYEAAGVLGYNRIQTFTKIIFPQMVKRVMPPVTNEVITLVKDTSLAFALAYTEMFTLAKQIAAAQTSIVPLFIAGLFYYIFNFIVAFVMERIEKKMDYYR